MDTISGSEAQFTPVPDCARRIATVAVRAKVATRTGTSVLRTRGLSVTFGRLAALQDVDLDVREGEIVGVAGDNGAGKSTLLRCICGDLEDPRGDVWLDGQRRTSLASAIAGGRVGVVWQQLALATNLDVAANLVLGKERRGLLLSESRFHAHARATLEDLGIPIADTSRLVSALTAAERQLLAFARAVTPAPRLLLLDEPTAVLGQSDSVHVEQLIRRLRDAGTTIILISHDIDQLFRLADRIVVLRRGRLVAEVEPTRSHPDELLALMAGRDATSAARQQLTRLNDLSDRLSSIDHVSAVGPSAGLTLILSTLGVALEARRLSLHVLEGDALRCVCSVGLPSALRDAWRSVPTSTLDDPLVDAAVGDEVVVAADVAAAGYRLPHAALLTEAGVASWWSVPFSGSGDLHGVIGVYRAEPGAPANDQLDLVRLYAGYAAAMLERDRLLATLTARNTVLEAIRAILQALSGPDTLPDRTAGALRVLREAVGAERVGLYEWTADGTVACRGFADASARDVEILGLDIPEPGPDPGPDPLADAVADAHERLTRPAGAPVRTISSAGSRLLVPLADGTVLAGEWAGGRGSAEARVLFEDAGHSILLAEEREDSERARQEMAALRRSEELQRQFLARLSHELRTPLTAINGYASSLLQTDVTWDGPSQHRFLSRISSESARLHRLVDELLDFSMIESGAMRLRPDWVDLGVVIDTARSCLSAADAAVVDVCSDDDVPAVWADHDRLEQVMVNLMDNAVRHNPPGTTVRVTVSCDGGSDVLIQVADDGVGLPGDGRRDSRPDQPPWHDVKTGAGLGLVITRGIVEAHHGALWSEPTDPGTRYVLRLPVESPLLVGVSDDA